jgi:hypothetical protein
MAKAKLHPELQVNLTVRHRANGKAKASTNYSALDWYKLTENTRHVLNTAIVINAKKQLEERNKPNPDQSLLHELKAQSLKITEMSRDAKNFESKERMQKILKEYAELAIV